VRDALASSAAGVICGSAIVKLANENGADAVREFVAEMKAATKLPAPASA
jgi:tryptophan synthase alpha subunit